MEIHLPFYHATTNDNWEKIQEEKVLFGNRGKNIDRCTYLAVKIEDAKYGDGFGNLVKPEVLLKVWYDPNGIDDNYIIGCWQFRVYKPIPIMNIKRIWR